MKQLGQQIASMPAAAIAELEKNGRYIFTNLPGEPEVTLDDVEITAEDIPGWLVANDGDITVALDITVTPDLRNEGMARELVNRIQNIRKAQDFEITDRVRVQLSGEAEVKEAVEAYRDYIASQVLASAIEILPAAEISGGQELDIDNLKVTAKVEKC